MSEIDNRFAGDVYVGNTDIDEDNYSIKIIILEQFDPGNLFNSKFVPLLNNTHYVFVGICFYAWFDYFVRIKKELTELNPSFNHKNIIFMTNNKSQKEDALDMGFDAIYCNHNAFLDEEVFRTNNKIEKIYDCVFNGSPARVKRPYLLKLLSENCNMAVIQGHGWEKDYFWDLTQLKTKFINEQKRLLPTEVVEIYNKSKIGVITSEAEGGSKVSGEYLLCGIPILSTLCVGGREVWYDNDNSLICDGSSEGVLYGYNKIMKKFNNGTYDSEKIHNNHLKLQKKFRKIFVDKVEEIFILNNIFITNGLQFFQKRWDIARKIPNDFINYGDVGVCEGLIFYQRGKCYNNFKGVVEILK
jgi:glycosyltransferase involved in cell wall biosynthesis